MKKMLFGSSMIVCFLPVLAFAVEAPGLRSPVGSSTQVPSSGRTSAIRTPNNLYGLFGNLGVTGNVGGGRHFRGIVPYSSYSYSGGNLLDSGSRSVSNFIRRSSAPASFYDPRRTVSSINRGGRSGLQMPRLGSQTGRSGSTSQDWLDSFNYSVSMPPSNRPLSLASDPLRQALNQKISPEIYRQEKKELPFESEKNALIQMPSMESELTPALPKPVQPKQLLKDEISEEPAELNIYQQVAEKLLKELQEESRKSEESSVPDKSEPVDTSKSVEPNIEDPKLEQQASTAARIPLIEQIEKEKNRQTLKEYGNFSTLADARYFQYINLGQQLLQEGKYYKAADAFELARVWRPQDALSLLGRSHALFAAGEYMSSALYLNHAVTLEPKLAQVRTDLVTLISNRDVFDVRLNELSSWQRKSGSGELAFLTAYVLFQDGKEKQALDLILYARERMEGSTAVGEIQKAIEAAVTVP